jgi:aminoglycoside 6'-N-acetyltransferase
VIGFRALAPGDIELVHEWRLRPHVARWWRERRTLQESEAKYLPRISGEDPVDVYLIELDERPVGMIQTYLLEDFADYWPVGRGPGVAGVDLFIGEEELTGRGLGAQVLRAFVRDVVFADPTVTACVADPDLANRASVRAFEKAGFQLRETFARPGEDKIAQLVRIER